MRIPWVPAPSSRNQLSAERALDVFVRVVRVVHSRLPLANDCERAIDAVVKELATYRTAFRQ